MNGRVAHILARYLSATEARSAEAIAAQLGCDLSELNTHIETLRDLGLEIEGPEGRGYRLKHPIELLERDTILARMDQHARTRICGLVIESSVDSTNSSIKRLPENQQHGTAVLAEHQSAGRGRRGRHWHSPYGGNLYLSLGWRFTQTMSELGCLSLVVALSAARALSRAGLGGHKLKWPNDLLLDGRKLGGCLVEMYGDCYGPCDAVVGVGINVHMPVSAATLGIDQPWTDLGTHLPDCSRNFLATLLLEELVTQLSLFSERGFEPFSQPWRNFDGLAGKMVRVTLGNQPRDGTVLGIDRDGALLLDTGEEVLRLHSGEVSFAR